MSQPQLSEIADTIAGLIPRLVRGLVPHESDPADELPLAQLRVCGILVDGPKPMSTLSRELTVSLSALTQIADRLERAGLVKRVAEEGDRRVRCLQLTTRGEKMMRQRRRGRAQRISEVLEKMCAHDREAVHSSLEMLVAACEVRETNWESVDVEACLGNGDERWVANCGAGDSPALRVAGETPAPQGRLKIQN